MSGDQDLSSFAPLPLPGAGVLEGHGVRLEPFSVARHGNDLWASLQGTTDLWTYMAYGPFPDRAAFNHWLVGREALSDPCHMSILVDGMALGSLAFMALRPEMGVAEVGHVVLSPQLQRTRAATAAFAVALSHLFALGYRRVEWKCDSRNAASRRAALRLGFDEEGLFRQHMIIKGCNRDTAWFAMLDQAWPRLSAGYEAWLSAANFDAEGRQRQRLADCLRD